MLRVGICDDEPLIIEALRRIILEIADKNGWGISISCFESGKALLEAVDENEIEEALQAIFHTQIGMKVIELYEKRNSYQIPQRDILYITAYDGYSEFVVSGKDTDRILRKDCSLSELEQELLKEMFFRVSRQYIVNFGKITEYTKGSVKWKI